RRVLFRSHRRRDLHLGGQPVDRRLARPVQQVRVVPGAHGGSYAGGAASPSPRPAPTAGELRRRTSQNRPPPTAKVMSTPTSPARPVPSASLSRPRTP